MNLLVIASAHTHLTTVRATDEIKKSKTSGTTANAASAPSSNACIPIARHTPAFARSTSSPVARSATCSAIWAVRHAPDAVTVSQSNRRCANHACRRWVLSRLSLRAVPWYSPPAGASEHCAVKRKRYTADGALTRDTPAARHASA